jgi:endonuclease/exonuclease/phosphatase family metal-dependent hydrolase
MICLIALAASGQTIRVVDWNIDKGKRIPQIVSTLRSQEADVVLLQEVDRGARRTSGRDVTREIAERLGMQHVFAPAFEELGQKITSATPALHGQSVLSRLPVRSSRVLKFSEQSHYWQPKRYLPSAWAISRRRLGGRIAQVVEVDAGGVPLVIYNLHLESRGWFTGIHEAQLREALRDAGQYGRDVAVVVGGDFNTVRNTDRARTLLSAAGFQNCFGDRKVRTHRLWGMLDWLAVRGPVRCEGAAVVRGAKGSDHDPLAARITFDASPRSATRASP